MDRFHALQEFDEGKRSCRRRLAGHNRRRRKAHPDTAVNGGSLNNESGSSYLLISLLRILSNMHCKYLPYSLYTSVLVKHSISDLFESTYYAIYKLQLVVLIKQRIRMSYLIC